MVSPGSIWTYLGWEHLDRGGGAVAGTPPGGGFAYLGSVFDRFGVVCNCTYVSCCPCHGLFDCLFGPPHLARVGFNALFGPPQWGRHITRLRLTVLIKQSSSSSSSLLSSSLLSACIIAIITVIISVIIIAMTRVQGPTPASGPKQLLFQNQLTKLTWDHLVGLVCFRSLGRDHLLQLMPDPDPDQQFGSLSAHLGQSESN